MSVLGGVVPWQERIKDSARKMAVAVTQLMIHELMKATVKQNKTHDGGGRKRGREEERKKEEEEMSSACSGWPKRMWLDRRALAAAINYNPEFSMHKDA